MTHFITRFMKMKTTNKQSISDSEMRHLFSIYDRERKLMIDLQTKNKSQDTLFEAKTEFGFDPKRQERIKANRE